MAIDKTIQIAGHLHVMTSTLQHWSVVWSTGAWHIQTGCAEHEHKVGVLAPRLAWEEQVAIEEGEGPAEAAACDYSHPHSLAGNEQSFSTDRYMLNHCYLCSEPTK